MAERTDIFISYSHKDRQFLDELHAMLKPLVRKGQITIWDDTQIRVGQKWEDQIEQAISSSRAAVLFVSQYFLSSDFIVERELPVVLKKAESEGMTIIWIAVRPSLYTETEIVKYQAANDPIKRPLASLNESDLHKELESIARKILRALEPFSSTREFEEVVRLYREVRSNTLRRIKDVPQSALARSPELNRWSILQILEHLLLAEERYRNEISVLISLDKAGREAFIQRSSEDFPVSPAFVPKAAMPVLNIPFSLISKAVPIQVREWAARTRWVSVNTAPEITPKGTVSAAEVSSKLKESADEMEELFKSNPSLDFEQMRHEHPSSGSNSPLDFFRLLIAHEQRHQARIDEILEQPYQVVETHSGAPAEAKS